MFFFAGFGSFNHLFGGQGALVIGHVGGIQALFQLIIQTEDVFAAFRVVKTTTCWHGLVSCCRSLMVYNARLKGLIARDEGVVVLMLAIGSQAKGIFVDLFVDCCRLNLGYFMER